MVSLDLDKESGLEEKLELPETLRDAAKNLNWSRGQNLLVAYNNDSNSLGQENRTDEAKYTLMKLEGMDLYEEGGNVNRTARDVTVVSFDSLFDYLEGKNPALRPKRKINADFLGSHRMDFLPWSNYSQRHLPTVTRTNNDLYLEVAREYKDGTVSYMNLPELIWDGKEIRNTLESILPSQYMEEVVEPFLNGESTGMRVPQKNRGINWDNLLNRREARPSNKPFYLFYEPKKGLKWKSEVFNELGVGDVMYIGTENMAAIYRKTSDDERMRESDSIEPLIMFKPSYMPPSSSKHLKPRLGGEEFVLPIVDKPNIVDLFNEEPQLITGNYDKALNHFKTTPSKYFTDVFNEVFESSKRLDYK